VDAWLQDTGRVLAWTGESAPIEALYQVSDVTDRIQKLNAAVEMYLAEKLAECFPYKQAPKGIRLFHIRGQRFQLPGFRGNRQFLRDLLATVETSINSKVKDRLEQLQARKKHILAIFPEADNKSLRDSLVRELNQIDSQIESAESGKTDYAAQDRDLLKQLMQVWRDSRRAREIAEPQARRSALRELISQIRLSFRKVQRGTRVVSVLDEVEITPNLGDPACLSPKDGNRCWVIPTTPSAKVPKNGSAAFIPATSTGCGRKLRNTSRAAPTSSRPSIGWSTMTAAIAGS
jgi:hypothetical protein